MKLLIVDDSPIVLSATKIIIQSNFENIEIITANNANEAIQAITTDTVDIILSDLCMPEINGDIMAKMIHENQKIINKPIIYICSSKEPDPDEIKNIKLYSNGFLPKPLSSNSLKTILSEFCSADK